MKHLASSRVETSRVGTGACVGTGAFARPGFRETSWLKVLAGCPILARFLPKVGIPRKSARWAFLRGPSWSKVLAAAAAITLTTACRIDMHVQPRQNPLSRSDFFVD